MRIHYTYTSTVWFLQFLNHFPLVLEARSKLILFYTKFWIKRARFSASTCTSLLLRSKPVQWNYRHFFWDFKSKSTFWGLNENKSFSSFMENNFFLADSSQCFYYISPLMYFYYIFLIYTITFREWDLAHLDFAQNIKNNTICMMRINTNAPINVPIVWPRLSLQSINS